MNLAAAVCIKVYKIIDDMGDGSGDPVGGLESLKKWVKNNL